VSDGSVSARTGRLLVYVGGLTGKPGDVSELLSRLGDEPGHKDDAVWVYPDRVRRHTRGSLAVWANTLNRRIHAYWTDHGCPQEIVLVGHSIGGVLLRYAYLCGCGRLNGNRAAWVQRVHRIVLLATPNRGVEPSRLPWPARIAIAVGGVSRNFAARELLAGAAFMTDLRLEWIRHFDELGDRAPIVVQVRGAADALVEPGDSRDVVARPNGTDFYLPIATHRDIMKLSRVPEESPGNRYRILRSAIIGDIDTNGPAPLPQRDAAVTDIVFLLHGIRAGISTWMDDLGQELRDGAQGRVQVVTASYGWFSAFNFALPVSRRRTLRWFQDEYSYVVVRHPQAQIHFVGHSNGTYMLGQSLCRVRSLRFGRVYLAGSVLPREFAWRDFADRGQIGTLVNACGTKDKPVAWLCSGLRGLGMRDIGTGGFNGFDVGPQGTVQFRNLDGGHGAGLTAQHLPGVSRYIRDGQSPTAETTQPPKVFALISRLAPVLSWLLVFCFIGVGTWTVLAFSMVKLLVIVGVTAVICVLLKAA
jgi:hypothetical protein